jgi:hypothetical protein
MLQVLLILLIISPKENSLLKISVYLQKILVLIIIPAFQFSSALYLLSVELNNQWQITESARIQTRAI